MTSIGEANEIMTKLLQENYGFESVEELNNMVTSKELLKPDKAQRFEVWRYSDCTMKGLLNIINS